MMPRRCEALELGELFEVVGVERLLAVGTAAHFRPYVDDDELGRGCGLHPGFDLAQAPFVEARPFGVELDAGGPGRVAQHLLYARLQAAFVVFECERQHVAGLAGRGGERAAAGGDGQAEVQRQPRLAELRLAGNER